MSLWKEFDFEARIIQILRDHAGRDHHMGPAFLSPYQIAIEFARLYPQDYVRLEQQGLSLGGEGAGTHNSLPQYIGRELSSRHIAAIEGGFLSSSHMEDLFFHFEGHRIQSSLTHSGSDVSLFRVKRNSDNTEK